MRILVKDSDSIIADLVFDEQTIEIGSDQQCGIHLPDMRVSSRHARLSPVGPGCWQIEPIDNNRDTVVNGRHFRESTPVAHGDIIGICDYTLSVYLALGEEGGIQAPARRQRGDAPPLPDHAVVRNRREEIRLMPARLEELCRAGVDLDSVEDVAGVMDRAVALLVAHFEAGAAWIGVRRQATGPLELTQGRNFRGQLFDEPYQFQPLVNRCLERGHAVWTPAGDGSGAALVAAPLLTDRGRIGFIYADSRQSKRKISADDLDFVIALARVITTHLLRVFEHHGRQRQALSIAENAVVQAIQSKLDPKSMPDWPTLQVAVHSRPGKVSSGDVYDVMELPSHAAAFLVGHVYATSVRAAISMVEIRTAFRIAVLHADMPHVMLNELNWLLCYHANPVKMDCAVVLVDPNNGALLHAVAGQPGAVVIGQSGDPRRLDAACGPQLGQPVNTGAFKTSKGLLGKRESLVLFTPGVRKMCNPEGAILGHDALLEILCDGFGTAARSALADTVSELESFAGGTQTEQDTTLLIAHRAADP